MKVLDLSGGGGMPVLGLGTWKAAPGEVGGVVTDAIDAGYRHLDCSPIYGNEKELGAALAATTLPREDLWVTSKLWNDRHARGEVIPALRETLADLQLDYLDLFLIHWPVAHRRGVVFPQRADQMVSLDELPLTETWAGMEDAFDAGLARHIGVSNFSTAKLRVLNENARVRPEVNQVELHPFLQQAELVEYCREQGIAVTAYAPLGSQDRSAAPRPGSGPDLFTHPVVTDIATRRDLTPAQVLLAWALKRGTSVIPKSANPERLRENLAAAECDLSTSDMSALAGLDRAHRYLTGGFWALEGGPYSVAELWDE